jgi:predicted NACHT family NTPase
VLKYFAQWLADAPTLDNLEDYLASVAQKRAGRGVSADDIQEIIQCCPCVLILDGLDEVISPQLRRQMLARIREFLRRTEQLGADLTVMATSRPTGYQGQFNPEEFWHLELLPLSPNKVSAFSKKWVATKKLREEEQDRILSTIEECQEDENLSALLKTPLQVTIILLVVKDGGRPPTQREALFDEYWSTIFRRERSKAKGIIQSDESLLFNMHAYLAYVLHRRAAQQNVQSLLPEDDFRRAVRTFLRRGDSHSPDQVINRKTEQLVREARDRLVLVVEPEPGLFGFELRSLQEFFAAVHLFRTSADTAQRFARLKAIARSEHWRNVALFFAGRVARLQGGEAGNILELVCRPLDREGVDKYLLRGAWLALEIASDEALGTHRDLQYNAIEYG